MFGSWWPSVASTVFTTLGICLLLGLTAWSLQALSRLWCCRGLVPCCSRTSGNGPDPSLQLEKTLAAQSYQDLKLVGPTGIQQLTRSTFNGHFGGKAPTASPMILWLSFTKARSRIDQRGMWICYNRVLSVTTRAVREQLEAGNSIHLCRGQDCQRGTWRALHLLFRCQCRIAG